MAEKEITKTELIEREKAAWKDVVRRLDFMTELVSANTDNVLIKDASAKVMDAIVKHKPLLKQRVQIELA